MSGNKQLTNKVVSKEYKKSVLEFEKSDDNTVRSIATYYASGVMGKRKNKSVRLVLSIKSYESKPGKRTSISIFKGCKVPKLLTFSDLLEQLKKIDIGTVHEIDPDHLEGLETENPENGAYRDLRQYLPMLAKFYLSENSKESLKVFAESTDTFQIALGDDGCPFGKNESAKSFLVSFLNVGRRVASSYDNFLIFGANCDESSPVTKKYVRSLLPQLAGLERAECEFEGIKCRFKLEELPNDMKMLAILAGELTISAKCFSPFANVSLADCRDVKGTFGTESSNTWKPWNYQQRVNVADKVKALRRVAVEKLSEKTKRSKIIDYITKQNSRQEFLPVLGSYIDKAHVEPLHLKNNAWQYFIKAVLAEAIRKSKLPAGCKKFSELPTESPVAQVITALQTEVKTKHPRFTGNDSRCFCHNFMRLIKWLSCESDSRKECETVLALA